MSPRRTLKDLQSSLCSWSLSFLVLVLVLVALVRHSVPRHHDVNFLVSNPKIEDDLLSFDFTPGEPLFRPQTNMEALREFGSSVNVSSTNPVT